MWEKPDLSQVRMQCPVCKTILGRRNKEDTFTAHCAECKATFFWRPRKDKPSVQMDRDIPERCGCGGCGR